MDHLQILLDKRPNTKEAIHNVYDLPSIEPAIPYFHAAAGFPTKATWPEAIRNENYLTWPLVYVKNGNKYFTESEETKFGHMSGQRKGVRSTKKVPSKKEEPQEEETEIESFEEKCDILIKIYNVQESFDEEQAKWRKKTIHTDQTEKFSHIFSWGHKYQMVLYHIDSNTIWSKAMKNKMEEEMIWIVW